MKTRIDSRTFTSWLAGEKALAEVTRKLNDWCSQESIKVINVETLTARNAAMHQPYPGEEIAAVGLRVWFEMPGTSS